MLRFLVTSVTVKLRGQDFIYRMLWGGDGKCRSENIGTIVQAARVENARVKRVTAFGLSYKYFSLELPCIQLWENAQKNRKEIYIAIWISVRVGLQLVKLSYDKFSQHLNLCLLLGRPCTVVTGGLVKCSWCFFLGRPFTVVTGGLIKCSWCFFSFFYFATRSPRSLGRSPWNLATWSETVWIK